MTNEEIVKKINRLENEMKECLGYIRQKQEEEKERARIDRELDYLGMQARNPMWE